MFGLGLTLVKGKWVCLTGSELFAPDLLTILTAYLFLSYGRTASGVFALSQGLFVDLFSGGIHGVFILLYLSVFCTVWFGSRFVDLQTAKGQVFIVLLAMLSKTVLFILMVLVVSQGVFAPRSFLGVWILLMLISALLAPVAFFILDRLKGRFIEDTGKGLFGSL